MGFGLQTTQKWNNRQAILITASTSGLDSEVRERFERRSWTLARVTTSVTLAVNELMAGRASFLIIDDTPHLPAAVTLRQLLNHKIMFFTPILVMSRYKDGREKACFSSMFALDIIEKPVSPARFIDVFEFAVFKWSNADLADLRAAGDQLIKGQNQTCLRMLTKLITQRDVGAAASCCLALFFRGNGDFKTAEKLLLSALKNHPKNAGVILSLVDLYLNAAMPFMAQRLLNGANAAYDNPLTLALDTVQTHLLLNETISCLSHLHRMVAEDFLPEQARNYLARLLMSEGLHDELRALLLTQTMSLNRLQQAWSKQDNPILEKAS